MKYFKTAGIDHNIGNNILHNISTLPIHIVFNIIYYSEIYKLPPPPNFDIVPGKFPKNPFPIKKHIK